MSESAKRTIEIVYSNSMKINRGNYEQEAPFYSAKTIVEVEGPSEAESVYKANYEQLKGIVEPLLKADYDAKRTDLANVRIREKDGKKYPSVTSILNPDGIYKGIKNLEAYKERGEQLDKIVKLYLCENKLYKPKVEKFDPLKWEYDVQKFCEEKHLDPSTNWKRDIEVYSDEWLYSGEIDLTYLDHTVWDVKSGQWSWEQPVAYAKVLGAKNVGIMDFKTGEVKLLEMDDAVAKRAWEKFIFKRGEFKARFGI